MKGIIIFDEPKTMEVTDIWSTYNYNHTIVSHIPGSPGILRVHAISESLEEELTLYNYMLSLNDDSLIFMKAYNKDPNRLPEV